MFSSCSLRTVTRFLFYPMFSGLFPQVFITDFPQQLFYSKLLPSYMYRNGSFFPAVPTVCSTLLLFTIRITTAVLRRPFLSSCSVSFVLCSRFVPAVTYQMFPGSDLRTAGCSSSLALWELFSYHLLHLLFSASCFPPVVSCYQAVRNRLRHMY